MDADCLAVHFMTFFSRRSALQTDPSTQEGKSVHYIPFSGVQRIASVEGLLDLGSGKIRAIAICMAIMINLSEYVKTAEAAEILGVAQNTIRKWAERGDIPVRRNPANGYRLFKQEDLLRFLKKIERSSKSDES